MRILIVTQHFPPERGAVRRLFEFARHFAASGHDVSVLTAIPNYPDGVVPPKYKGHFLYREEIEGVKVFRSWVLPASNQYPGKRMIGFVVFLITSLINSLRLNRGFDVVLASTPPVNTPVIGWLLSKIHRTKFIIEIRDLQPESSEDFGNLNRSVFTRLLKKMMHGLYRRADKIVSATDGISTYLHEIGLPPEKVMTIKSGFSPQFATADYNGIRKKFGWEDKFLILYSGTLGWAHSLETVVEAARKLNDQPDILFVFVGEGEKRTALEGMVRDYGLKNVVFTGSQPLETIPHFLKASDVLIESLQDVPITRGTFPAKLFEYMASGRPIIFGSGKGEAVTELERAGGALAFSVNDVTKLCDLILKLKRGEINGDELGAKYKAHAVEFHPRERWARQYLTFIQK
ncbi:glycosyltransferase [candidate division GN15 bacterium]|nr:glycosyltransferase [candidate division GN15 bacterium]